MKVRELLFLPLWVTNTYCFDRQILRSEMSFQVLIENVATLISSEIYGLEVEDLILNVNSKKRLYAIFLKCVCWCKSLDDDLFMSERHLLWAFLTMIIFYLQVTHPSLSLLFIAYWDCPSLVYLLSTCSFFKTWEWMHRWELNWYWNFKGKEN